MILKKNTEIRKTLLRVTKTEKQMRRFMVNFSNQKVCIIFFLARAFTWNYNKNIGFDVVQR